MVHARAKWSALVWAGLCCQLLSCHLVFPFDLSSEEDSQVSVDSSRDVSSSDAPGSLQDKSIDRGKKPVHDQKLPPDQKPSHDQKFPPDQKQPLDGGGSLGQCANKTTWDCKAQIGICTYSCPAGAPSKLYTIMCTEASGGSCSCFNQTLQPLPCSYIPPTNLFLCEMCYDAFDKGCCVK